MAIANGSLIEISLDMNILGQTATNVWSYVVTDIPVLVSADAIAAAWWNHVKTLYRNIPTINYGSVFRTVRLTEANNPTGDYATFSVPVSEQTATRNVEAQPQPLPPFCAIGVRLNVGSRATRPGQKRLPGLAEEDSLSGLLGLSAANAANALMAVMTTPHALGAPAALTVLVPSVFRRDAAGTTVVAHQPVTGWAVNANVSTQNSRKFGRGS